MKVCRVCSKSDVEFAKHPRFKDGLDSICKGCKKDREKARYDLKKDEILAKQRGKTKLNVNYRKHDLKRRFGITVEEFEAMLLAQNNLCKICKRESLEKRLAVDHCHTTGKVRGLLCTRCNLGIGYFQDDPNLLIEAVAYLRV